MVVSPDGNAITAREHPRLLRVATALTASKLEVTWAGEASSAPFASPLVLSLLPDADSLADVEVKIWGDRCVAKDVGADAAAWFSAALEVPCRLVWMASPRAVKDASLATFGQGQVSFGDALPCLVVSKESLDDLNARMDEPLSMERFRPNLIVEGCPSFDEDLWASFSIGDVGFSGVKLCDRCVLTTIAPDTGAKSGEPLVTLATYRKQYGRIYFGQNAVPEKTGQLVVGDSIDVHRRAELISFAS